MAKPPRAFNERRQARESRKPFARALIICEGKKTEPYYLRELVNELRASTAAFKVIGEGADPGAVVAHALEVADDKDCDYDYIFCVFDRDKHARYADACARCSQKKLEKRGDVQPELVAVTSNPSFEYWLLIHFDRTTRPYRNAGNKSSGDLVLNDFQKALATASKKKYSKGMQGVYGLLRDRLDEAIKFSANASREGLGNPHTLTGKLVEAMREIAEGKHPNVAAMKEIPRDREEA